MERRNLKDAQKRVIFARLEHTRVMLRALLKDRSLPQSVRFSYEHGIKYTTT